MPDTERVNGRFAFPFLAAVAAIVFTQNLAFLVVPFGFLLIIFLTIVIHEMGHLIAGLCVGLRFKGIRIGPFALRIDSGRWKFQVIPRIFWGFTLVTLDRVRRVRRRLIVCIAGGPLASIVVGLAAVFAGEIGLARYDSPWLTFLEFLGAWSTFIGFLGLFPFRAGGYANDGMLIRALLFRKAEAVKLIVSYALSSTKNTGFFPPDYFLRWFRLASVHTKLDDKNYYSDWLAYHAAQDQEVAAGFLEGCLKECAPMDDDQREQLIAEATFFTAWRRNDAAKAEIWLKRIRSLDHLHPLWQTKVRIALLCAHQQFGSAKMELDRAFSLIREAPDGAQRQRFEAEWINWGQQIEQRIPVEVA